MKTIKFIAYLFYRYYSTGARKDIPYTSTICSLTLLFVLNLYAILILSNQDNIIPAFNENNRVETFFKTALCLLPIGLLFIFLFKNSELQEMDYDIAKVKKGNLYLILYIILSMAFIVFAIWYKKGLGF